jgi:D-alanine-D-alanine ligase
MHIGFIYNIATEELLREFPEQILHDADTPETIEVVRKALEAGGHTVTGLNADRHLPRILTESSFDIVFNIATGVWGETRQAHVPAMLEYLRIPHTGSGVLGESLCHHKPETKMVFQAHGLPTAPFQVMHTADDPLNPALRFPLIVKLTSEGASMGLDYNSVVYTEAEMRAQVRKLMTYYQSGVMVEEYIDGREFTVAVLGNSPPYALPVAELEFFGRLPIRLDQIDDAHIAPLMEVTGRDLEIIQMESRSNVPANLPAELETRIQKLAVAAFQALHCQDWARVDLRMDQAGKLYLLEVNLNPGIDPEYIFPRCAFAAGWSFEQLINTILQHGIERYPHLSGRGQVNPYQRTYLGSLAVDRDGNNGAQPNL